MQIRLLMLFSSLLFVFFVFAACESGDGDATLTDGDVADGDDDALPDGDTDNIADGDMEPEEDGDEDGDVDTEIDGDIEAEIEAEEEMMEGYPDALPFTFTREQEGEPLTEQEITAFTKKITGFWKDSAFFDWVWWTSHGLDASYDPEMPDYKLWWQDTQSYMENGVLRFSHTGGADNLLLRTCKILNNVAAAYLMTGDAEFGRIVEAYSKGIVALSKGMEWGGEGEPARYLQARAIFTHNHEFEYEGGRKVKVEYDEVKKKYSYSWNAHTIPNPSNPYFGEIWLRTMRSKDDVPHFYRSVPMLQRLVEDGQDESVRQAAAEALAYVQGFAKDVVDEGYNIRSVNRCGQAMLPSAGDDPPECPPEDPECRNECLVEDEACTRHPDCALSCEGIENCTGVKDLASFVLFEIFDEKAECTAKLGSALISYGEPLGNDCEEGISDLYEPIATSQHYFNTHIIRIFHVAAGYNALMQGRSGVAREILEGMGQRARRDVNDEEKRAQEDAWDGDLSAYLLAAAAAGMPLTNHEARVVRDVFTYSAEHYAEFPYWDPWNTDGLEGYFEYKPERCKPDPDNEGRNICAVRITEIAHLLEYCYSPLRNPTGAKLVDCEIIGDPSRWGE